jgi:hypothetical protein
MVWKDGILKILHAAQKIGEFYPLALTDGCVVETVSRKDLSCDSIRILPI